MVSVGQLVNFLTLILLHVHELTLKGGLFDTWRGAMFRKYLPANNRKKQFAQLNVEKMLAQEMVVKVFVQDENLQETGGKLDSHPRRCPKHRRAARKATSTEAVQKDPETDARNQPNKPSPPKKILRDTSHDPEEKGHRPLNAHRYSICLLLSLAVREKIICRILFVRLHISEPTPDPLGMQSQPTLGPSHAQSHQPTPLNS